MGFPCVRSVSAKKRKEKLFLLPSNVSKNFKAKRITKIPYPNESLGEIGGTEIGSDGEDEDEEGEGEVEDHERNFTSVQDSCEIAKARRDKGDTHGEDLSTVLHKKGGGLKI